MSTLSQHRAIHSDARPYVCEVCQKTFNRVSTLISHRRTHFDDKPHKCHVCGKGFHQKGNLKNHLFSHSNERVMKWINYVIWSNNNRSNLCIFSSLIDVKSAVGVSIKCQTWLYTRWNFTVRQVWQKDRQPNLASFPANCAMTNFPRKHFWHYTKSKCTI
jgi:hypothetical protein